MLMKPVDIPVVAEVGVEEGVDYMPMPREMNYYQSPALPEVEDLARLPAAARVLDALAVALEGGRGSAAPSLIELDGLSETELGLVDQVLGHGEVSIIVRGAQETHIQESVLAGVWRIAELVEGRPGRNAIEVAHIPAAVCTASAPIPDLEIPRQPPEGVGSGLPILVELLDHARSRRPGEAAHVVNLTLLPVTAADLQFLDEKLGAGEVTILSRGYGNCRIAQTAFSNIWWVRYFNATDTPILDTLEVVDVPIVACAADEDIADSARRLHEIVEALR
jgi:hydrogenase-1 operon protein HyaF